MSDLFKASLKSKVQRYAGQSVCFRKSLKQHFIDLDDNDNNFCIISAIQRSQKHGRNRAKNSGEGVPKLVALDQITLLVILSWVPYVQNFRGSVDHMHGPIMRRP